MSRQTSLYRVGSPRVQEQQQRRKASGCTAVHQGWAVRYCSTAPLTTLYCLMTSRDSSSLGTNTCRAARGQGQGSRQGRVAGQGAHESGGRHRVG